MTVQTATIHELDTVELLVDLPDARMEYPEAGDPPLHVGDRGVVVFAYEDGRSFTVEFFRDGETVAITDVTADQIRFVDERSEQPTAHLEYAFLAEEAYFVPGGSSLFNAFHGGFTSVTTSSTPVTIPRIVLVMGIGYTEDGLGKDHDILVIFRHPDEPRIRVGPVTGGTWIPHRTITHPPEVAGRGADTIMDVIHAPYANPLFSHPGRYEFQILIDGREVRIVYFTVIRQKI